MTMGNINKMVQYVIDACNDPSVGYSWYRRWRNPDVDCSSLMYLAANAAGYNVRTGSGYTGTMLADFTAAGFVAVPFDGNLYDLDPGDIALNVVNHTEMYIGNNQFGGAHIDENGDVIGTIGGDQTGNEVSIGAVYNYPWDYILIPPADDNATPQPDPAPGEPEKTVDVLAKEVIAGMWGNNPERSNKLSAAGYDANAVQQRVNEIINNAAGNTGSIPTEGVVMTQIDSGYWRDAATMASKVYALYDAGAQVKCVGYVNGSDPYGDGRKRWVKSKNNGKYAWEGLFDKRKVDALPKL